MRFAAVLLFALASLSAYGHGGGLDRNGCHTNRKTGEYHCHGAPTPAAEPREPVRSPEPARVPTTQRVSAPLSVHSAPTTAAKDLIRAAQVLLRSLGYQPSLLGALDARTQSAVRAFQRAENLEADGVVSEYLVVRLAEKVAAKCP